MSKQIQKTGERIRIKIACDVFEGNTKKFQNKLTKEKLPQGKLRELKKISKDFSNKSLKTHIIFRKKSKKLSSEFLKKCHRNSQRNL